MKALVVFAGYVAALIIALVAETIYIASTPFIDRQLYSGMSSFGDAVLFLAVFAVAALPPTALALHYLKPCRPIWIVLSVGAVGAIATSLAAFLSYLAPSTGGWSALAPLRLIAAPGFVLFFVMSAFLAPTRSARLLLFAAAAAEVIAFAGVAALLWTKST